ncbi:MAG TPA: FG-GAP-like repeat-containing protein, partial [Vicinamibacteria bacterium]|nr:FG-GAP-like repeat-containing protein [Vicinamibacteria bacterium]
GGLRRTQTLSVGRFGLASDLADLDGDGDLDWIVSNFEGGWTVLRNDGRGAFAPGSTTAAPAAGSCALALDSDGDGDLDLALIDEVADQIVLLRNR